MSENAVEISVKLALEQFQQAANQLVTTFNGTMSKVEADAAIAGGALDEAFRSLGVKSVRQVEAEVTKLQTALGILRATPGVLPADAERATQAFNARLKELRGELNGVPAGAHASTAAINTTSASLGSAAKAAAAWTAALVGISGVTELAKNVIETGSAFEQLEGRLTSLLGSQEASAAAFADIKKLAADTPFEVKALTEAYAKLTAFGLQPTTEQMMAFADTAASLGGGTQMLERVTLALGQAWTKGKLQGGEIMQMAEAGVPVWDLLASATGKNVAELQRLSEEGRLGKDVITQLIAEMGKVNAGASAILMDSFAGAVSNAKDATAEFFSMIAKSGVLDYLKTQIQEVLVEFERMKDSGELQAKAQAIADTFLNIAEATRTAIGVLQSLSGVIKLAIEAFAVQKVIAFSSALRAIAVEAVAGKAAMTGLAASAGTAGAAAAGAAASVGLLARGLSLLKGLTFIGLAQGAVELGMEFFRAKRAAEEGDAAVRKMLEAKPAPVKMQVKEFNAEIDAGRVKLTEWQAQFKQLAQEGKTTGEALKTMVGSAKIDDLSGISALLNGLESVRKSAQATGLEIEQGLAEKLKTLTATQVRDFGIMAKMAFDDGRISADMLKTTLNEVADSALAKLGIAAETSLGGMTAKFVEAQANAQLVADSFDVISASGMNAGQAMRDALDATLKAATSTQDLAALADQVTALGKAGQLAKRDVDELLDSIKRKAEDATPAIDSVAEAFRKLGIKSQEELKKVAASFKEADDVIQQSTTATLREKQEAFAKYANAAIAANDGVVGSFLKAKAESMGLTVEVDRAGNATVRLRESGNDLERNYSRAADQAGRMAGETERAAAAAKRAAEEAKTPSASSVQTKGGIVEGGTWNSTRAALDLGITDQATQAEFARQMAIRAKETERAMYAAAGSRTTIGVVSEAQYAAEIGRITQEAAAAAKAATAVRPEQKPQSVIHLTFPGLTDATPLYTDTASANALVSQLRAAGAVSSR